MADNPEPTQWSVVLSANESGAYTHQKISSADQLTSIIQGAATSGLAVIAGAPAPLPPDSKQQAVVFTDLSDLNAVLEDGPADQVIQVQTGMTVAQLNALLAKRRQWWPIEAPASASIMDVLHTGEGGCLEHGYGGPRDLVLGMNVVLGSGEAIKCGGKVVKNVSGYDIGKLFIGSRGWLGIIVSAHLRLYALPETSITSCFQFPDALSAYGAAVNLMHCGLPLSALEVLSSSRAQAVAHGPSIQLLQAVTQSNHQSCALVIRTQGIPAMATEVSEAASTLLTTSRVATLADGADLDLWQRLADQDSALMQLNCCARDALLLIDLCAKHNLHGRWQWRPSKGKLFLEVKDAGEFAAMLAEQRWHEPLITGFATASHHYRLQRFPDDPVSAALKLRLKQQYDPSSIMNPFVAL